MAGDAKLGSSGLIPTNLEMDESSRGGATSAKPGRSFVIVMSALGTLLNTENICRFPRVAAQNSGGTGCLLFIVVWLLFLPLWVIPMMLIEFAVGRYTGVSIYQSAKKMLGDKFGWCGLLVTFVTFLYGCTFLVTISWCLHHAVYFTIYNLPANINESLEIFNSHAMSAWPLLWEFCIFIPVCAVVICGFSAVGITNVVLVITIYLTTGIVLIWQLTRDRAGLGLAFLFTPSWGTLYQPSLWTSALAHTAYDAGTGMCLILTYATMLGPEHSIVKFGVVLPLLDASVSLFCAMLSFSMTFSLLHDPSNNNSYSEIITILEQQGNADTGITFTWMPVLFGYTGQGGQFMCVLYYVAISCAALTSFINFFEFTVRFLRDCDVPRVLSVVAIALAMFIVSIPSVLSNPVFINQSTVWRAGTFLSCLILLVIVIKFGAEQFAKVAFNELSHHDWHLPPAWVFMIKYVLPLELTALFCWYCVTEVRRTYAAGEPWYAVTADSLTATLIEWLGLVVCCVLGNFVVYYGWKLPWTERHPDKQQYESITE